MEVTPKEVFIYATPDGKEAFTKWVNAHGFEGEAESRGSEGRPQSPRP